MKTCANCKFWHAFSDMESGECRRRAPVFLPCDPKSLDGHWPRMNGSEWCGEIQLRVREQRVATEEELKHWRP